MRVMNVLLVLGAVALRVDPAETLVRHTKNAGGGYKAGSPLHAQQEEARNFVPPVSTTMKCIITLATQYFVLYSVVAVLRTYIELRKVARTSGIHRVLDTVNAACSTVNYAPMMAILFLGVRMRAVQLSQGEPDRYELPTNTVKSWMWISTVAVLIQAIIVLVVPVVMKESPKVLEDGTTEFKGDAGIVAQLLSALQWVAMILLYGGIIVVCHGAFTMPAPAALWADGAPPVSPAVSATINLTVQYFAVYFVAAVQRTYEQLVEGGRGPSSEFKDAVISPAKNTVNFAPMLCVLFIGARMRALQIDPVNGAPQAWAQNCFYLCAYSVLVQLLLVLIVPLGLGGKVEKGETDDDISFTKVSPTALMMLAVIRYGCMLALYGGFTAVIVSVFAIEAKEGPTPAVSPAMQCVMNLTSQYFFVYLLLWVLIGLRQLGIASLQPVLRNWIPTVGAAKGTVQFCPMLAVLFIGLRMRALQITNNKGAPQGYAQQAMYLSTYAVLLQLVMVFVMPLLTSGPTKTDRDGNVQAPRSGNAAVGYFATFVRYFAMLMLYGGAVTVVVALFKITPDNATGSGSLIPGVNIPQPTAPPVPGTF